MSFSEIKWHEVTVRDRYVVLHHKRLASAGLQCTIYQPGIPQVSTGNSVPTYGHGKSGDHVTVNVLWVDFPEERHGPSVSGITLSFHFGGVNNGGDMTNNTDWLNSL